MSRSVWNALTSEWFLWGLGFLGALLISWSVYQLKKHDKGKLRWWTLGLGFCNLFFALNMWFVYSSFSQDFRAVDFNDSAYTIREIIPVKKYKLLKKNKQGHLVKTD